MARQALDQHRSWEKWRHRDDPPAAAPPRPRFLLEYRLPLLFAIVGVLALAAGCMLQGKAGTSNRALLVGYLLAVDLPFSVIGLQVLGCFFRISYGPTASAFVKLLGLVLFLEGTIFLGSLLFYPFTVRILLFPVSWLLLSVLFDLDGREMLCSMFGLWLFHLLLWATLFLVRPPEFLLRERPLNHEQSQVRAVEVVRRGPGFFLSASSATPVRVD
jgi:hypothetical protein